MKIEEVVKYNERIYEAVTVLIPQLGSGTIVPAKEYFRTILESASSHLYALKLENKEIAGILTLCICRIPTGIKAWIEDVVVNQAQRGKGYGKALLLHAMEFARSEGAKAVELTSRPSRIEANHLYQKLGFVVRETNLYMYTFSKA